MVSIVRLVRIQASCIFQKPFWFALTVFVFYPLSFLAFSLPSSDWECLSRSVFPCSSYLYKVGVIKINNVIVLIFSFGQSGIRSEIDNDTHSPSG